MIVRRSTSVPARWHAFLFMKSSMMLPPIVFSERMCMIFFILSAFWLCCDAAKSRPKDATSRANWRVSCSHALRRASTDSASSFESAFCNASSAGASQTGFCLKSFQSAMSLQSKLGSLVFKVSDTSARKSLRLLLLLSKLDQIHTYSMTKNKKFNVNNRVY